MAMGSTGVVNITPEMMRNAIGVVEDYREKMKGYHDELTQTVEALIPANFSGSAAEGFKFFYTDKINPAFDEGLIPLIQSVQDMLQAILDTIPGSDGLDDQLGDGNRQ
ncbi:MAG: WXG100 family type VII secretion target [Lachnospiraceae bacterium]|nr:WXG100 family type VII secretion target [Lachnospiraceae bacterium]